MFKQYDLHALINLFLISFFSKCHESYSNSYPDSKYILTIAQWYFN